MNYIGYYRVSTQHQGQSGLGLEAQREAVRKFIQFNGNRLIGEFIEIESGKNDDRPMLRKAILMANENDAILVIARLDRLSRNVTFISTLMDSRVRFKCVDMPEADETMIGIMAVFAQRERKIIAERTKAGLDAKRRREPDWKPGTPNLTDKDRQDAWRASRRKADENQSNRHAFHFIRSHIERGLTFSEIAKRLNQEGYQTRYGRPFHYIQVRNLWNRFKDREI